MTQLFTAALALTLCAAPLAAQTRTPEPLHRGFWIGFGLGAGLNLDAGNSPGGFAGHLRMGGTLNPQLLIGGESAAWGKEVSGATVSRVNTVATVLFYPQSRGLYLKSGLGFGLAQVAATSTAGGVTTSITVSETGLGATFGTGYDLRIGGNLFLTPAADLLVQVINAETDSFLLFTLGLTWH